VDSGVPGRYRHVRDRRYAERVMAAYWLRHCPTALARGDWQTLARVHNGGPKGGRSPETADYWRRVQRRLER
jgi:predicted chitinase